MLSALLYLQYHSIVNRLLARFRRLKQPKYLFGGIVGAIYFYFYFFRHFFRGRSGGWGLAASPENLALYEGLGALLLLVIVLLAWILPHQRAALTFTEAEVAFLFPAPISRSGLVHFKLLRSQFRILATTFLLTLITNRFGGRAWIHAAGWWLILSTLSLHFLGSSFARTLLLERGISNWQRRLVILAVVASLAGVVMVWARRSLPAFDPSEIGSLDALKDYVRQVLASGPAPYLLFPLRLVVRPYLAPDAPAFFRALGPTLLLLALQYWWVARSNVAFEEASVEASKKMADKIAAVRSGNWQAARKYRKGKRPPFRLASTGPPAVALLWKNLISAGQMFNARLWIMLAAMTFGISIALQSTTASTGLKPAVGLIAAMLLGWSVIIGPQFLRQDFRQDLALADVLKTYPMPGWQIALGELLAPAAILTGVQWVLLILAVCLSPGNAEGGIWGVGRFTLALGAAPVVPMLNLITLQIPNAAVLLFPGWFQTGKEGAHGIEATGQRLIFLLGQFVVFVVAVLPAGLVFVGILLLIKLGLGIGIALPCACLAATMVLAGEASLGLLFLGRCFERLDLSAELNP